MKKPTQPSQNPLLNNKWQIIFLLTVLTSVSTLFYYQKQTHALAINAKQFATLLEKGEIKDVVLIKKEDYVKIRLTDKAFYYKKYRQGSKALKSLTEQDIHYIFKIVDAKTFHTQWDSKLGEVNYQIDDSTDLMSELLKNTSLGSVLLLLLLLFMTFGMGSRQNSIFNIGRSKAAFFDKNSSVQITFNDVKGISEAKQEVKEIVDFLKYPAKYTKLGGRMPKGILLVGPPGCGKTLLAKAVAGEAEVPFFSISGSDFVEMFVGVGASRVRDLFQQAKKSSPCIIFIDEIDAVGKDRGGKANLGSNDERDQTLNQLLTEMDGFDSNTNIIILAATNRPDVLDSALKRPGRFDRQVAIDKPTLKGREEIFDLHLKPIKISPEVSAQKLARQTAGFTGADIANVCNRAALIAGKKNKKKVQSIDLNEAIDQIIGGLEKKDKLVDAQEKNIVAYHEAGHAIVSQLVPHANPLVKVSIIPRGIAALGYAQYLPKEKLIWQKKEMLDEIGVLLGGRAAEEIFFNDSSTGAQNDLEVATRMVYNMIAIYGMSPEVGLVSFKPQENTTTFAKPYSEETAKIMDNGAKTLLQNQYQRILKLLKSNKDLVEKLAQALLAEEVLYREDVEKIMQKDTTQPPEATPAPTPKQEK
ncbi:MAG: ATP-dependent zinc metalloprotease FtsH [Bacteroidota bacterium]